MLDDAKKFKEHIINNRRALHRCPGTGFDIEEAVKLVLSELEAYGYKPERCGRAGVTCTVGQGPKTILLRADMDGLPIQETSGLPFASDNGNSHACGHDAHTAMLLGAARLLKEKESGLKGVVKFMFQPAEEKLAGARDMIEAGILENPKVDAAMAIHIIAGREKTRSGALYYVDGASTFSADCVKITVTGKDAHGSTPNLGIDAIQAAAQIITALQNILAKEVSSGDEAVLVMGKINGGTAENSVAGHCEIMGSIRAATVEMRQFLKQRITEISEAVATAFRAKALVEFPYGVPPAVNDDALSEKLRAYAAEIIGPENVERAARLGFAEDFCLIGERVPSVLFLLGMGSTAEGYDKWLHHPAFLLNEEVLPTGAALYAHCAEQWLAR